MVHCLPPRFDQTAAQTRCRMCRSTELASAGTVDGHTFLECKRCGLAFCPDIRPGAMADLYSGTYHGPDDGAPEKGWADARFLRPALDILGQRGRLRILDFGTGQSEVPRLLRRQGHRVITVDLAPPLEPHPDRLTGDLASFELAGRQFDLIFSFQVFEHLPEPRPVLFELLRLLKPDGLLLIHTDMETPERSRGLRHWWYVTPPDHCCFYRPRSFAAALAGSAHRVIRSAPKSVIIRAAHA